ncbi:hypothetical protein [Acinetobacter baumannii]|uniref:hypothetical protein n=1 Tax=Acinetobacter baumannii TaxID=470 RepID=UPI0008246837|nr:hypothetical protein [Acinetobacter baumannii]
MNPFGPTTEKPLALRAFDSAAENISTVVSKVSSTDREQQSVIEQVRQIALNILSDTVDTISEGKLEEGELKGHIIKLRRSYWNSPYIKASYTAGFLFRTYPIFGGTRRTCNEGTPRSSASWTQR